MTGDDNSKDLPEQRQQPAATLGEAMRRAGHNALTSKTMWPGKSHVLARGFEKSVAKPWAEFTETLAAISDARKSALASRDATKDQDLFANVSQEQIDAAESRSSWSWLIYQSTYLMAIASIIYSYQLSGLDSIAAFFSGIMLLIYGIAMSLKSTRDILSLRQRRIVPSAEVLRDIDKHWRPVLKTHAAYALHKYAMFPVTVAAVIAALYATVTN